MLAFATFDLFTNACKIRSVSKRSKSAYLQVGVETYGGGIWHSWLDRDLSIAGRVVVFEKSGVFNSKLVKIDRPILRIPSLAIHCQCPLHFVYKRSRFKFNQWIDRSTKTSNLIRRRSSFLSLG